MEPEDSADILEEMDETRAAELMAALPPAAAARILDEMEPDEAADLLGDLDTGAGPRAFLKPGRRRPRRFGRCCSTPTTAPAV